MFFKKPGFPEEGEIVLCSVSSVQYHSVFVELDEYGKRGMIHISEVSPGRIRNIRDFVKEGKKIVCKVLKVNKEKGHIDLSLRRVNDSEKRRKIDEVKKEQNAEKIIEHASVKAGIEKEDLYKIVYGKAIKKYKSLSQCFDDFVSGNFKLEDIGVPSKYIKALSESITQRIKPQEVSIKGKLKITTYDPKGIDVVKESLKKMQEIGNKAIDISYLGSGMYMVVVKSKEYKEAERKLSKGIEAVARFVEKHDGVANFIKE